MDSGLNTCQFLISRNLLLLLILLLLVVVLVVVVVVVVLSDSLRGQNGPLERSET